MKKALTTVAFNGTAEQLAALDALIAEYKGQPGALMPVLQKAQDIYGYLPEEVQRHIAAGLDVPYSEVFGIVTFYAQFLLNPKGEHPVAVCLGTACYVKGSGLLMDKLETLLGIGNGGIEVVDIGIFLEESQLVTVLFDDFSNSINSNLGERFFSCN